MDDQLYMTRCLQLALLGKGHVAPNPMVGAVLVVNDRIIGEGFHQEFGEAHAEVNCIRSVKEADKHLVSGATLYVSLEPCSHFGKTPPCTELILSNGIRKVVIGIRDPFPQVNGKGIEILKHAGVHVQTGVLENECFEINRSFFLFHRQQRPYVILKWAQSSDNRMADSGAERVFISNAYSNRLVHKWRSEVMGIMVGSNTVVLDDPLLTTRHWPGKDPVRIILDPNNRVDEKKKVLDRSVPTIVFNYSREEEKESLRYIKVAQGNNLLMEILEHLYSLNIQSLMIEGGAKLLQSFIEAGIWDEARVITNENMIIGEGLPAPLLQNQLEKSKEILSSDTIRIFSNERIKNKS